MKKKIIYVLVSLVVIAAAFVGWKAWYAHEVQNSVPASDNAEVVFFYGKECPHCKIVEEYLDKENVRNKVSFSEREVYHNPENAKLMMDKQQECGLDKSYVGAVPFLWTKDKCFIGQDEIIQFFKDKVSQNAEGSQN